MEIGLLNIMIQIKRDARTRPSLENQADERVVAVPLHMHSGIGYLVTSLPILLVLSSGCPMESWCSSRITFLNSASGREEFKKYGIICLLFGIIVFLCPAYALCPYLRSQKRMISKEFFVISQNKTENKNTNLCFYRLCT